MTDNIEKIAEIETQAPNLHAEALFAALREAHLTFAAAESCTGGLVCKLMTDVPGVSEVFSGGVVSYANEVKIGVLGVPEAIIKAHGAVSEETALEMARGVRRITGTGVSVALTGIAGPGGGSKDKPVGLVYIAVSCRDKITCERCVFTGTREEIRTAAAEKALQSATNAVKTE